MLFIDCCVFELVQDTSRSASDDNMPARPYRDNPFEAPSSSHDIDDYYGDIPVSVLSNFNTAGFRAEMCIFIFWQAVAVRF